MFAALHGHLEVVDLLIKDGADVALVNNLGKSASDLATEAGRHRIIGLLGKKRGGNEQ